MKQKSFVVVVVLAAAVPSLAAAQQRAKEPAPAVPAAAPAPATPETVERITLADLKKLVDAKNVLIVDVRSAEAYKEGHIAGAVSAPLGEIEKHLQELKAAGKPIVTYCT